ncbi:hypothetical protein ACFFRR_007677 [Megaselia abdita]
MKITSTLVVLTYLAGTFASLIPSLKEFEIHDALKASMKPEVLEDIQRYYNLLQSYEIKQRSSDSDGEEIEAFTERIEVNPAANNATSNAGECLYYHLKHISDINTQSYHDGLYCEEVYTTALNSLQVHAQSVQRELDDLLIDISQQLLVCQNIVDVELAFQCHADLAVHYESIEGVITRAKIALEKITEGKIVFKGERDACAAVVITRANLEIDAEHLRLVECIANVE